MYVFTLDKPTRIFEPLYCPAVMSFIRMLKLTGSSVAMSRNESLDGMSDVMNGSDLKPTVHLDGTRRLEQVASSSIGNTRYLLPLLSTLSTFT